MFQNSMSMLYQKSATLMPGLVLCATIAMAAMFLSTHYGAPVMLFALLLGMAFNFIDRDGKFIAGVNFASRTILRIGVALLGARITFGEIANLGWASFAIVIVGLITTILLGIVVSKIVGRTSTFGLLTGGAVGICGASAALALTSVLPKGKDGITERDTIFTVVAVTTLSTIAMVIYPLISNVLGLDEQAAGVFIGATVHDVAQVVGAGYSISEASGDTATVVKLLRVAMLVPVVGLITLFFMRRQKEVTSKPPMFPLFLIGFVLLVAVNSVGFIPASMIEFFQSSSKWALVVAISGLGMKTSLKELFEVGPRAMAIILVETIWIALFALVALKTIF